MSTSPGQPAPKVLPVHHIRLDVVSTGVNSGPKLYAAGKGDPDNGVGFVSWPGPGVDHLRYPRPAWAERFAACVNLLVGIPTETLLALDRGDINDDSEVLPVVVGDKVRIMPKEARGLGDLVPGTMLGSGSDIEGHIPLTSARIKVEATAGLPPLTDTLKHAGSYGFASPIVTDPRPSHITRNYGTADEHTEWFWYEGPPPHIGWWNASLHKDPAAWRWWNGELWSWACFEHQPSEERDFDANQFSSDQEVVQWTYQWPEGARVPRINPDNGNVTGAGGEL